VPTENAKAGKAATWSAHVVLTMAVPTESVIGKWYRQLALEFHPNRRGSHEGMIAVNRANELLQEMVAG
jgi:hypothetical protein